ncbi:MAG: lipopolysaccharide biosynthesis protein [Bythopirellula sp.]|nr:lipopolysaccharide biosynthesis protein [Bythopirellula sp.]
MDYFCTDDLHANLASQTARGGRYTVASLSFNFLVTAVSTIWLTRELMPADFGLYGMVLPLVNFASMFVDLGLSRAVVQKPQITHEQVSTLFWINLAISALLSLLMAAATPLVVAFYREPQLATLNLAMSGLFIITGLTLQHRALLQRRMEFGKINAVAAIAPLTAAVVAITIALMGGRYWALVALLTVSHLTTCLGMWIACRWRPGLPRRGTGVREMLTFGGHVTGFQFINYFARNADNVMLGYVWGKVPLGIYTRAYSLMMLPVGKLMTPLDQVLVPTLSRLVDNPERYRLFYRSALTLVATVCTFSAVAFILISPELIPLVLGEKWREIVPLFLALSPAVLVACTNSASSWLYLSFGHVNRQSLAGAINATFMVAAMLIGLPYGPLGMAIAVSISRVTAKLPYVAYSCQGTAITIKDYVSAIFWPTWVPVISALGAFFGSLLLAQLYLFPKQSFSAPWEALPISPSQALLIISVKLTLWIALLGLTVVLIPAARSAVVVEPLKLLRRLVNKKN